MNNLVQPARSYKLLASSNPTKLSEQVQNHLEAGWKLFGETRVSMATESEGYTQYKRASVLITQAVIKE